MNASLRHSRVDQQTPVEFDAVFAFVDRTDVLNHILRLVSDVDPKDRDEALRSARSEWSVLFGPPRKHIRTLM